MGEIVAFVNGWSLLLEYSLRIAILAKIWTQFVDSLASGHLNFRVSSFTMNVPGFSQHLDILSCILIVLLPLVFFGGIQRSSLANKSITGKNLLYF